MSDCELSSTVSWLALADVCVLSPTLVVAVCCPLHFVDSQTCVVTWSYNQFGDCSFTSAGPKLWNSLPAYFGNLTVQETAKRTVL